MIGTLLIATGATLIAVFGVVSEPNHSLDELLVLFARAGFVAYFVIIGVAVFGVLVVVSLCNFIRLTPGAHCRIQYSKSSDSKGTHQSTLFTCPIRLRNYTTLYLHPIPFKTVRPKATPHRPP